MAEKRFIIEVRTKGFSRATRDFKDLDTNTKQARKSTENLNKSTKNMRGSFDGIVGSLGSLRNRLLVYSFALGSATVFMNRFIGASAGFQDVRTRLVGLTGSVQGAEEAFRRFNAIASTTPFQLQDVVSAGAQLEAFGLNSKATLSALTDLAAFMGTNATEAASALGRAFAGGAGAADILRERGILQIIKDSQGIEDLSKVTLPEFRVALLNALSDPQGQISGSAERLSQTFSGALSNMRDSVTRLSATIGDVLLPSLTSAIKSTDSFVKSIDTKELAEAATSIAIVGTTYTVYRLQATLATIATLKFGASLKRIGVAGIVVGLGLAVDKILEVMGSFDSLNKETEDFNDQLKQSQEELEEYKKSLENATGASENLGNATKDITKNLDAEIKALTLQAMALDGADKLTLALQESGGKLSAQDLKNIAIIQQLELAIRNMNAANKAREEQEKKVAERIQLGRDLNTELLDGASLLNVALNSNTDSLDANIKKEELRLQTIAKIQDSLGLSEAATSSLRDGLDLMNTELDKNSQSFNLANGSTITFGEENNAIVQKIILAAQNLQHYNDTIERNENAVRSSNEQTKLQVDTLSTFNNLFLKTDEGQRRNIENTIALMEANKELIISQNNISEADFNLVVDDLNSNLGKTKDMAGVAASAITTLASGLKQLTAEGMSQEQKFASLLRTLGSLASLIPGGQGFGAGFTALSMLVGHTGGLIGRNSIQRFATGGMVQGQDNVPIMAQAGEFIMQRSAVQNIGVQNLADMNRTGSAGGGSVTVNISAPLVDDTVVESILPAIERARRLDLA